MGGANRCGRLRNGFARRGRPVARSAVRHEFSGAVRIYPRDDVGNLAPDCDDSPSLAPETIGAGLNVVVSDRSAAAAAMSFPPIRGVVASCAILTLLMGGASLLVGLWLGSQHGSAAWGAAAAAGALCYAASLAALLVSVGFSRTPHAMAANLSTMLIRMGLPLVGLMVLPDQLPSLSAVGLANAILILYLVGLATETILAVRHIAPSAPVAGRVTSTKALGA